MKSREETIGASVVWVQRRRTRWHSRRESQRKPCQGLGAATAPGSVSMEATPRLWRSVRFGPMTREDVDRWLEAYVEAWKTYDRGQVEALFAEDISYRYHPEDEPVEGREAVVDSWLQAGEEAYSSSRDE